MKHQFIFLLLFAAFSAFSQPGPIKIFRYFDDFSYLQSNDSINRNWYEKLKFIPLGQSTNVSFGGEVREMYQYFQNQNFGDVPPFFEKDTEGFLWHRVMAHADFRFGDNWRLFTQLNSTFTFFKQNPLSPQIDENRLSLHQAFLRFDLNDKGEFLQAGRQEFGKGTQMIIGMREGPNTRLTFDAFLIASERENRQIYSFIATPVIAQEGVFDDEWIDEWIWTMYVVNRLGSSNIDLYYFGFHGSERLYRGQPGTENRQTLGFRFWKSSQELNYSLESNYQFGTFDGLSISAFMVSFLGDYSINKHIAVGSMLNYMSGDDDPQDQKLNTYNLLYSKPQFGLATPIGSTNIINVRPMLIISPKPRIKITLSNYWIWRESENDGIYTPAAGLIRSGNSNISSSRFFGSQSVIEFFYSFNTNLQFFVDYALFQPGSYVRETGEGETLNYFSFKTSFKF